MLRLKLDQPLLASFDGIDAFEPARNIRFNFENVKSRYDGEAVRTSPVPPPRSRPSAMRLGFPCHYHGCRIFMRCTIFIKHSMTARAVPCRIISQHRNSGVPEGTPPVPLPVR
jgi:hypothetical protein